MTSLLGPSWKPKVAGILTPIVPIGLWFLLTGVFKLSEGTATEVSAATLAMLASYGLYNAKASNVSNSPVPLITPQIVSAATMVAVAPPTTPDVSAIKVTVQIPPEPAPGHLVP
jgi:hypothetical protein